MSKKFLFRAEINENFGFLMLKFLKILISLAMRANQEKRSSKEIIAIPKIFLERCKYRNFFVFNQL